MRNILNSDKDQEDNIIWLDDHSFNPKSQQNLEELSQFHVQYTKPPLSPQSVT